MGWIFAHDAKQYGRWHDSTARRSGRRQSGKSLAQLARDLGAVEAQGGGGLHVVRGEFEFWN